MTSAPKQYTGDNPCARPREGSSIDASRMLGGDGTNLSPLSNSRTLSRQIALLTAGDNGSQLSGANSASLSHTKPAALRPPVAG